MSDQVGPSILEDSQSGNVCVRCATDYGGVTLPRIAGVPVCDACRGFFKNRPFPAWIKGSLAATLLLAVLAFIYNERFFFAHVEMLRGLRGLQRGDLAGAVTLFDAAAGRVPEVPEVRALAQYFHGALLVNQERPAEALPLLREAVSIARENTMYALGLAQAEAGVAFDRKDYGLFLEKTQELARRQPDDPIAAVGVASAYACQYAVTGDEALRLQAVRQLDKASAMAGADGPDFTEYADRVRYRLETREIISRKEYLRRFPNGRSAGGG